MNMRARSVLAMVCVAGAAGAVFAQAAETSVLEGPKVKDLNTPVQSTFDGAAREGKKRMQPPIPHPMFVKTIHKTLGEDAPEGLRLTEAQAEQIEAIDAEFRASVKAYMDENRDEVKALREAGLALGGPERGRGPEGRGEGRGRGRPEPRDADEMAPPPPPRDADDMGRPPAEEMTPEREALRERARALREGAPKPTDAETKMWAVLTPEQQAVVRPKLDALKDEMAKEYGERALKAKRDKRAAGAAEGGPGVDAKKGRGKGPEGGPRVDPALREKVEAMTPEERMVFREKMKNASPEERKQIVEDLKNSDK